jgi:valyl-tRNA synthetase
MFGDSAIAVHQEDQRYHELVGKSAYIPYSNRKIEIIEDEHCDMSKGSGAVKITPAHDHNDFKVGKRHNLKMIQVFDTSGHILTNETIPEFLRGVFIKKARKILIEKLKEDSLLEKEEKIIHSIPYGDRSGEVVEPMLMDQWFIDTSKLAPRALNAVEYGETSFFPDKWKNTYFDWMRNIEPWCISRQISWGHQIPVWYHIKRGENWDGKRSSSCCSTYNSNEQSCLSSSDSRDFCSSGYYGQHCFDSIICAESEETALVEAKRLGFREEDLVRETDVLDTWFSSALWTFATLGWPENTENLKTFYPTNVLVTGFDIIFFWVARMMMMSIHFMNEIPFKDVYIHALVKDEDGQKMSKSKGNVIDPMDLINEFGADALRFTLAFLSVPGRDIRLGREHVKISRNFITKIWNAARFLQVQEVSFEKKLDELEINGVVSKWLLYKLKNFKEEIKSNIEEYRFDYATRNIQYFIREIFCGFFVEAVKITNTEEMKNVAGCVFIEFLRIANPFIPFVTDYLASVLRGAETLMLPDHATHSQDIVEEVERFVDLINEIRSVKGLSGTESSEYSELISKIDNFSEELRILKPLVT